MRLGICNELFVNWSWNTVCDFAAAVGYQGIEVAPLTLADRTESVTAEQWASRGGVRRMAVGRGF